jgi:hypothetical protein
MEDFHNAVDVATSESEMKLLNRDSKKEYAKLKEILLQLNGFDVRFVTAYIKTASASEAARLAGSNSKTPETVGYKTLQKPLVQQAIAIAMKKRIEAVGLDTVEVIEKTRRVYDEALAAGKYESAMKACDLLNSMIQQAMKLQPSKAGQALVNKDKPIALEDGVDTGEQLNNVLSLIQSKS